MTRPTDIPEAASKAAQVAVFEFESRIQSREFEGLDPDGTDAREALISIIARAIMAAKAEERALWQPAAVYFDRYCQDEAEDVENCVCGVKQHEDAKAFAAAIRTGEA